MNPNLQPKQPLDVLLIDDHHVVRVGVKTILADDPRLRVVGEASSGAEGLRLATELRPRVVLLDLRLPDQSGDVVCRQLKSLESPPVVLILTSFGDDDSVLACQAAGADGYLLKDFDQTNLSEVVVQTVTSDYSYWPNQKKRKVPTQPTGLPGRLASLTSQEIQLMQLMVEGRVNKEIAEAMSLSPGTVRNCVSAIYAKLGVSNRTEAVVLWLQGRGVGDGRAS
jgi:two-component system, NarL family, response regulator DevR